MARWVPEAFIESFSSGARDADSAISTLVADYITSTSEVTERLRALRFVDPFTYTSSYILFSLKSHETRSRNMSIEH